MGVLDIPVHRLFIGEAAAYDVPHIEDYHSDDHQDEPVTVNGRPQKQRTPKLGRKVYGSHDIKRGNGVRRKRRNENLVFLFSLVDDLNPDEIQDEDELNMTAFGELFIDPTKMRAWAEFMGMTEEDQLAFLEVSRKCKKGGTNDIECHTAEKDEDNEMKCQEFARINRSIRDFLRSDDLAKEALAEFEEDLITSLREIPFDILVLDVPSSFDRMMIHGLCQYMQLQSSTHKFKKKRLMEIESKVSPFNPPSQLLTELLETFNS